MYSKKDWTNNPKRVTIITADRLTSNEACPVFQQKILGSIGRNVMPKNVLKVGEVIKRYTARERYRYFFLNAILKQEGQHKKCFFEVERYRRGNYRMQ